MPIKNLSEIRRLPRLGKIQLGIKKKHASGSEYPSEVDYFVVPPEVEAIYGKESKELKIMFPVENQDVFFQQWLKSYGFNLLKCKGDGQVALTWDEEKGGMKEIPCPCEKIELGECKRVGILQFLLPDVPGAGVWQITTSSRNSIIDLNSGIDYIRSLCGRVRMIPLILRRTETEIQRIENGKPKKGKHYTLSLDLDNISLRQLQASALIPPERAFLPPPDESKDDLFFPPAGFEPAAEEKEKKEIPPKTNSPKESEEESETDDISDIASDGSGEQEEFRNIPMTLSNGKTRKVTKFEALKHFANIKEEIGAENYYEILGSCGYEKSNEIPAQKIPGIYDLMVAFWKETKTIKREE